MNEQGKMMNQQQRISQNQMISMTQPQMLNPQQQQQQQPQMAIPMNRSYRMWPPQQQQPLLPSVDQLKFQNPNPNLKQFKHSKALGPRNNWKGKNVNNKNDKRIMDGARIGTSSSIAIAGGNGARIGTSSSIAIAGGNVGQGGYKPPTLNDLQRQNRLKARRFFPNKKKFYNNNSRTAPYAPRNTSSYIIRAKKSGGIASLVSPCPVTPAVLPTPIFSPSREVLVDMAKEEWGVDGYGSMNGLIRLRSPGGEGHEDEEEEEGGGGSSESDVEEHVEVERRLDHDLSRFEMIYPNYSGMGEYNNVLGNRVDDQDTHIAQLEEENLILKDRLFLMERELSDLRRRLQSLERQGHGCEEMNEEVVENESENDSESHGNSHSLEDNNVELVDEGHMERVGKVKGIEENRIGDEVESADNKEKEGEKGNGNGNDEAFEKESETVRKEDGEEGDCDGIDEAYKKEIVDVGSKGEELNEDVKVKIGDEVQFTQLTKNIESKAQALDNASVGDVIMEEASTVDAAELVSQTKKEDELPGNE